MAGGMLPSGYFFQFQQIWLERRNRKKWPEGDMQGGIAKKAAEAGSLMHEVSNITCRSEQKIIYIFGIMVSTIQGVTLLPNVSDPRRNVWIAPRTSHWVTLLKQARIYTSTSTPPTPSPYASAPRSISLAARNSRVAVGGVIPLPLAVLVPSSRPVSHSPAGPPPSDDDNGNDTEQHGRAKSILASGSPTSPALPHSSTRRPTPALTNAGPPAPSKSRTRAHSALTTEHVRVSPVRPPSPGRERGEGGSGGMQDSIIRQLLVLVLPPPVVLVLPPPVVLLALAPLRPRQPVTVLPRSHRGRAGGAARHGLRCLRREHGGWGMGRRGVEGGSARAEWVSVCGSWGRGSAEALFVRSAPTRWGDAEERKEAQIYRTRPTALRWRGRADVVTTREQEKRSAARVAFEGAEEGGCEERGARKRMAGAGTTRAERDELERQQQRWGGGGGLVCGTSSSEAWRATSSVMPTPPGHERLRGRSLLARSTEGGVLVARRRERTAGRRGDARLSGWADPALRRMVTNAARARAVHSIAIRVARGALADRVASRARGPVTFHPVASPEAGVPRVASRICLLLFLVNLILESSYRSIFAHVDDEDSGAKDSSLHNDIPAISRIPTAHITQWTLLHLIFGAWAAALRHERGVRAATSGGGRQGAQAGRGAVLRISGARAASARARGVTTMGTCTHEDTHREDWSLELSSELPELPIFLLFGLTRPARSCNSGDNLPYGLDETWFWYPPVTAGTCETLFHLPSDRRRGVMHQKRRLVRVHDASAHLGPASMFKSILGAKRKVKGDYKRMKCIAVPPELEDGPKPWEAALTNFVANLVICQLSQETTAEQLLMPFDTPENLRIPSPEVFYYCACAELLSAT
ncbi:hypothetical protein DFH09DRAFT_1451343, partial [Mycena vulgaris]